MIFLHHPPKVSDDKKTPYLLLYMAFGDATLSNWARASLLIWPKAGEGGSSNLSPEAGQRLGWDGSRFTNGATRGFSGRVRAPRM